MVIIVLGALVVLLAGVLLVRLGKALEPKQRVVLVVLVILAVAYVSYGVFRGYQSAAQIRQEQDNRR